MFLTKLSSLGQEPTFKNPISEQTHSFVQNEIDIIKNFAVIKNIVIKWFHCTEEKKSHNSQYPYLYKAHIQAFKWLAKHTLPKIITGAMQTISISLDIKLFIIKTNDYVLYGEIWLTS